MHYAGTRRSEHSSLWSDPMCQAGLHMRGPIEADRLVAHPDAALLILCGELRILQGEWQALWHLTTEDWGLDDSPITAADREWLAFNDHV